MFDLTVIYDLVISYCNLNSVPFLVNYLQQLLGLAFSNIRSTFFYKISNNWTNHCIATTEIFLSFDNIKYHRK